MSGDVVAALRDNKGRSLQTGPLEQFVTVHPRRIQQDRILFDEACGTSQNRINRLTLVKMSSQIRGLDPATEQVLAITDMFVIPTGAGDKRQPWILLSFIVAPANEQAPTNLDMEAVEAWTSSIHESYRRNVCINFNLDFFVSYLGTLEQLPYKCDLQSFFEINRDAGYSPVVLHLPESLNKAEIALLPSRKGFDACILHLTFASLSEISASQAKSCFTTPDSFVTNANLPLRNSWSDVQREVFLGAEKLRGEVTTTREGNIVAAQRVVAQNSLSTMDLTVDSTLEDIKMQVRCVFFLSFTNTYT